MLVVNNVIFHCSNAKITQCDLPSYHIKVRNHKNNNNYYVIINFYNYHTHSVASAVLVLLSIFSCTVTINTRTSKYSVGT